MAVYILRNDTYVNTPDGVVLFRAGRLIDEALLSFPLALFVESGGSLALAGDAEDDQTGASLRKLARRGGSSTLDPNAPPWTYGVEIGGIREVSLEVDWTQFAALPNGVTAIDLPFAAPLPAGARLLGTLFDVTEPWILASGSEITVLVPFPVFPGIPAGTFDILGVIVDIASLLQFGGLFTGVNGTGEINGLAYAQGYALKIGGLTPIVSFADLGGNLNVATMGHFIVRVWYFIPST